jgi:hypothetical protein
MERRWKLKFKDENAKMELLFLSFMGEEAEESLRPKSEGE